MYFYAPTSVFNIFSFASLIGPLGTLVMSIVTWSQYGDTFTTSTLSTSSDPRYLATFATTVTTSIISLGVDIAAVVMMN